MSESVEKDGHGVMLSSNDEASTGPAPATSDGQIHPPESMISPRGSESDIPFPFESQSSLDEENGHGCKIPNTILHLRSRTDCIKLGGDRYALAYEKHSSLPNGILKATKVAKSIRSSVLVGK